VYFKQFYLGCLAQASYMIGSRGEAVVVDPRRDVEEYLHEAKQSGLRIMHVVETHLHADFVSGHCELARRTGATIHIGVAANAEFEHEPARDGDELTIGDLRLRFLETPGHTPEGISILVYDTSESVEPTMILTGDTLFIGDVGRPDLTGSKGFTKEQMAGMLYDTLREKILVLPDAVEVYPAHGAGSSCGKNLSTETHSSLGEQRRSNYALQPMTKEEFIRLVTADLPPPPRYFAYDAEFNRHGAQPIDELEPPRPLAPDAVRRLAAEGAVLLDVRENVAFGAAHVPGSINIGLKGQFASWAGTLLDSDPDVVLVANDADEAREARVRLARVGFDHVEGYLEGGIDAWRDTGNATNSIEQITVETLRALLEGEVPSIQVVDVRRPVEYASGHVPGAQSVPLDGIDRAAAGIDPMAPTAVICAGGYRSSAATSLLETRGFRKLYNVLGGTSAWLAADYPVER
jgi:glyoxylase-like metal-dependent hydrolase (beta-lactamase superfamily II)/rhodanese-related sulfurtransferase